MQEEVGKQAVKALENVYGTKFRLGTGADILCMLFDFIFLLKFNLILYFFQNSINCNKF